MSYTFLRVSERKKKNLFLFQKLCREIGQSFEESQGGEVVKNLTETYK